VKLVYTATPEATNLTTEQGNFLRYTNARRVQSTLFDHTNGAATGYSERLNGGTNEKYGVARSMSVMPGDTIKVQVYAKYADPNTTNWNQTLTNLMSAIASNTGGIVVDGGGYSSSTSSFSFGGLVNTGGSSPSSPKAFLNWIIFDRDYNFKDGGFVQVSQAAKETGTDGPHEKLSKNDILIKEPGYIYIYLSNEETSPVEVFFDDLNVVQVKSPVVQTDDYYPFGLTFNSYQRENSVDQKFKFQGQEHIDDLGLGWDSFKWRNHMPDIGRFFNVDPLAESFYYNSPYAFSENKVTTHIELEGLEAYPINPNSNPLHYMAEGFRQYFDAALSLFSVEGKAFVNTSGNNASVTNGTTTVTQSTSSETSAFIKVDLSGVMDANNNNEFVAPSNMVESGVKTTVETTSEVTQNLQVGNVPVNVSMSTTLNPGDATKKNTAEVSVGVDKGKVEGKAYINTSTTTSANGSKQSETSVGVKAQVPVYDDKKRSISIGLQVEATHKH
jgi:RHS repeat-associated protein